MSANSIPRLKTFPYSNVKVGGPDLAQHVTGYYLTLNKQPCLCFVTAMFSYIQVCCLVFICWLTSRYSVLQAETR